jgi:SAM-dependent methyltransferase
VARLAFALRMLKDRWREECGLCPYCESRFSTRLQRKHLLIEARRCMHCGLIYRWPTDPAAGARDFYETAYDGQQATTLPDGLESADPLAQFSSAHDKTDRVRFLERTLGSADGRSLLDFGCSWGYSVRQYLAAGWQASGFELDRHRAALGPEKLKVEITSSLDELRNRRFDVILSDHSLEHVPRPGSTLQSWSEIAAHGGVLVLFVPNGSSTAARRLGVGWGPFIGESHTVAFTHDWFARNLPRHGWRPTFHDSAGQPLAEGEYLTEHGEICLVAHRMDNQAKR